MNRPAIAPPFCAICAETGDLHDEELDGITVKVCRRCAGEHPRAGGYGFGGGHAETSRVSGLSLVSSNRRRGMP